MFCALIFCLISCPSENLKFYLSTPLAQFNILRKLSGRSILEIKNQKKKTKKKRKKKKRKKQNKKKTESPGIFNNNFVYRFFNKNKGLIR